MQQRFFADLGEVLVHGLALTAGGVVLGAAAALSLTRLMGNLLYKVSPRDPLAFGSAIAVMAISALTFPGGRELATG